MRSHWKPISFALATLWVATLVTGLVMSLPGQLRSDAYADQQTRAAVAGQNLAAANDLSTSFRNVAELLRPSVVSISTTAQVRGARATRGLPPSLRRQLPPGFEQMFPFDDDGAPQATPQATGQGSGVIVRADGYILTNNHVVEGADEVTVELSDNRKLIAEVVGTDPQTDLAVLKVDAPELTPVSIGDSEAIQVGDWVLAIGSPFGLDQTVTAGIISGKNRVQGIIEDGRGFEDFLQTDAAINPGNSGGALVNLRGELVGINTAILSRSGGNAGIGFAIPVGLATPVLESIIEFGEVRRGFLGAQVGSVTAETIKEFALKVDAGAVIMGVIDGQPAAIAGLQPGDVVVKIDGKPVTSGTRMVNYIASRPPGASVTIEINRNGVTIQSRVDLQERTDAAMAMFGGGAAELLGATLVPADPKTAEQYGYDNLNGGLIVTSVEDGGIASRGEIQVGDVIEAAGNQPVDSDADLAAAFKQAQQRRTPLQLVVRRGNARMLLVIR